MRSFSTAAVMAVIAVMALSLVDQAVATCPNACSNQGTCGDYDSCTCYSNFQGPDCSLRTCPHHFAWATTSKGDLNFDGDTNDATMFDPTTKFADSGVGYVATQANSGGDWEGWPSTFSQTTDEGHFYMECANRGTCDRKLGLCKCFEGYTGAACQRTTCPEACNGRGSCKSVNDQKSTHTYTLWDGDMSHSCVCDKGFSGPSCADRSCPVGDDPMTMDQQFETQWIEISSPRLASNAYEFTDTIRLTYTDHNGETYETDKITVAAYEGSPTTTIAGMAAALNGLPNNLLSGVTVTEGYCETAIPGTFSMATHKLSFGATKPATHDPSSATVRCDFNDGTDSIRKFMPQSMGGDSWGRDDDVLGAFNDEADVICYTMTNWYCNRYKVTFAATPGDHTNLVVDTAGVKVNGKTEAGGATNILATVSETLGLGNPAATNGIIVSFSGLESTATKTAICNGCTIVAATKVIDLSSVTDGSKYEAGERIVVTCGSPGVAWGTFTVDSVATDAVTVTESIMDCSQDVSVALASYVIDTNTYLEKTLAIGDRLIIAGFASVPPTILKFSWLLTRTPPGRIFLSGAYIGDIGNSADGDEAATTPDGSTYQVQQYGKGTTENSECADRGVCNSETGACKCFKGYTGLACSTQNALSG